MIDPLTLFQGDQPTLVLRLDGSAAALPRQGGGREAWGSIRIEVDPEVSPRRTALLALLRTCHERLSDTGRLLVVFGRSPRSRRSIRDLMARAAQGAVAYLRQRTAVQAARAAGFHDVELFSLRPSREDPQEVRPAEAGDALRAGGMLLAAGKCANGSATTLATAIRSVTGSEAGHTLTGLLNSSRGKSVALAETPQGPIVLRIARSPAMNADEGRGHALLVALHGNPRLRGLVPRPLGAVEIAGLHCYAQGRLPGAALREVIGHANRPGFAAKVGVLLRDLNPDASTRLLRSVSDLPGAAVGEPMIPFVLRHIADTDLRRRSAAMTEALLADARCRLGVVHGDFGVNNLLVSNGSISGVIDWEAARDGAAPVLDALNYLDSAHRACHRDLSLVDTLPMLVRGEWPVAAEFEMLMTHFDYCGVDRRQLPGFVVLYFIFHIGPQLRFLHTEPGKLQRLHQVLGRLTAVLGY